MRASDRRLFLHPGAWVVLLWGLLMARACSAGFSYWPQLDDYIQYHNYLNFPTFAALQETVGLLASRPLAGLADYYVWGPLFDCMLLGVAIISLLWAVTVVLLWHTLGRFFSLSPLFPVLLTLFPLGIEGTYWMSASTRVVVSAFWAVLALWLYLRWLEGAGSWYLALYFPCQLLPFGFYEQGGLLSVTLTVGCALLWVFFRRTTVAALLPALWAPASMMGYLALTRLLNEGGVYASRTQFLLPVGEYYWKTFLPELFRQFQEVFLRGGYHTLFTGFSRGMDRIISGGYFLWLVATLLLCISLFFLSWSNRLEEREKLPLLLQLICGGLLALAPVSLFFVVDNTWFSMRGAVTSVPGLALMADAVLGRIFSGKKVLPVFAAAFALIFSVAGVSELADYRDNTQADQRAGWAVVSALEGIEDPGTVGILGMESSFLPEQNFRWHEHICGCTESDWALTGLARCLGGEAIPMVTPLPSSPIYRRWNAQANDPQRFDRLYWYNGAQLFPVRLEQTGERTFHVLLNGEILGRIWEENGLGYFALEP